MRLIFATYILLLFSLPLGGYAQVDSTAADSTGLEFIESKVDSTDLITLSPADTTVGDGERDSEKPLFKVIPWQFHAPTGAHITATDSSLRWQVWPDWTYKLNREAGVISYRMGTSLRSNAVQRFAHEPRHQQLYWEGISLNDPVSGMLNWSLIPQHKIDRIYGQDLGTQYRNTFYLHQYYLNQPLSRLIYTESKFTDRNLEFEVSHNLSQRMNIELSYWDRRAGGEYPNSEVIGRQIYGKLSYHLDHRHYLKLNFVNNKLEVGRPFGYITGDLRTFNFDRYNTSANQSGATSTDINNFLTLNFYRRSADSTQATDNLHAGLFQRTTQRKMSYRADSTAYKVRSVGLTARKWWSPGMLEAQAGASYELFFNSGVDDPVLATGNWGLLKGDARLSVAPVSFLTLGGAAAVRSRSDGQQSYRLNLDTEIRTGNFTLSPALSSGTVMPTHQQLYWQSESYAGNPGLGNEEIQEARVGLSYALDKDTRVGVRVQQKNIKNGIMVAPDSTFANTERYTSQSATAFFDWEADHFEFNGSATLHQFNQDLTSPNDPMAMPENPRIWFKGGAYWKGYLFNRATYVKAGLSGMITPSRYRADHYNPELDYWQPVSSDQQLPVFNRLDVDISARVRSIIFVLRFQNVLDDVAQLGYFETAGYPMSQRKFIFGVRALFRN